MIGHPFRIHRGPPPPPWPIKQASGHGRKRHCGRGATSRHVLTRPGAGRGACSLCLNGCGGGRGPLQPDNARPAHAYGDAACPSQAASPIGQRNLDLERNGPAAYAGTGPSSPIRTPTAMTIVMTTSVLVALMCLEEMSHQANSTIARGRSPGKNPLRMS